MLGVIVLEHLFVNIHKMSFSDSYIHKHILCRCEVALEELHIIPLRFVNQRLSCCMDRIPV